MLKELIIKESVKTILAVAARKIKGMDFKLKSNDKNIEESLNQHLQGVKNWSNEVTFKDLKSSKQTNSIYIPLQLYVYPQRIRMDNPTPKTLG